MNAGAPPSPASDIYSFGLLLLQMLTGELPWTWAGAPELSESRRLDLCTAMHDDKVFLEAVRAGVVELRQYGSQRNQYIISAEAQRRQHGTSAEQRQQQEEGQQQQQPDRMGRPRKMPALASKRAAAREVTHASPVLDWEEEGKEESVADAAMLRVLESCLAYEPAQRKGASELLEMLSEM